MSQLSPAGHQLAATFLLVLLAFAAAVVSAQPSPQDEVPACKNDIDALWNTCKQFVQKNGPKEPPSDECCKTVKAADAHASCLCDYLGSDEARKKLSLEKVLYAANQCGVTVLKGCGE